eukprot:RCo040168
MHALHRPLQTVLSPLPGPGHGGPSPAQAQLADSQLDTLFVAPSSAGKVEAALSQYRIPAMALWKPAGRRCTFAKFAHPGRASDALLLLRQHFHAVQYAKRRATTGPSSATSSGWSRGDPALEDLIQGLGAFSAQELEEELQAREEELQRGVRPADISEHLQVLLLRLAHMWCRGSWVPTPVPGAPSPDDWRQPYYDPRHSNSLMAVFGLSCGSPPGDFMPLRPPTVQEACLFSTHGDFYIDEGAGGVAGPRVYRFRLWEGQLRLEVHPSHTTRAQLAEAVVQLDPGGIRLEAFDEEGSGRLLYET